MHTLYFCVLDAVQFVIQYDSRIDFNPLNWIQNWSFNWLICPRWFWQKSGRLVKISGCTHVCLVTLKSFLVPDNDDTDSNTVTNRHLFFVLLRFQLVLFMFYLSHVCLHLVLIIVVPVDTVLNTESNQIEKIESSTVNWIVIF